MSYLDRFSVVQVPRPRTDEGIQEEIKRLYGLARMYQDYADEGVSNFSMTPKEYAKLARRHKKAADRFRKELRQKKGRA